MAVNLVHSWLHRVETGWDPISPEYAQEYAQRAGRLYCDTGLVERLDTVANGLGDKRVLDLGGGPGQYSVLFAQRGARVVWHDVSREYERIARTRALANRVAVEFSLGYLEAAKKFGPDAFDLVFCRVAWYYSRSDRRFAHLLYSLVKPGGIGYVECDTPVRAKPRGWRRGQHWLNEYLWWKIGHPLPPHGRITSLLQKYPLCRLEVDYSSPLQDIVIFTKSKPETTFKTPN